MQIVTNSSEVETRCLGVTKLKYAEIVDSIVILTEEDDEILEMYVFVNTLIKNGKTVKRSMIYSNQTLRVWTTSI